MLTLVDTKSQVANGDLGRDAAGATPLLLTHGQSAEVAAEFGELEHTPTRLARGITRHPHGDDAVAEAVLGGQQLRPREHGLARVGLCEVLEELHLIGSVSLH